jgi:uncharacterized protein YndB with AHSA1/START domain
MIEVEFTLGLSPRQTWHVLTDPLHMEKWWGDNVLLEPQRGGKFSEDWTDDDGTPRHSEGQVMAIEPEKRLQLTWQDDGWQHETRVEFMLSPNENGTRIYLQHSGWEKFEDEDQRRRAVDSYHDGWQALMKKFQEYAATLA